MSTICTSSIATVAAAAFTAGQVSGHWLAGSIAALCGLCLLGLFSPTRQPQDASDEADPPNSLESVEDVGASGSQDPLSTMISQGRTALLLRPQVCEEIAAEQRVALRERFRRQHAFIHAGGVMVPSWTLAGEGDSDGLNSKVQVEAFWMDRKPVTNREFAQFVEAGGYGNLSFWRESAWPVVNQFTNQAGELGPRGWTASGFPKGQENFPVVGVSWYEADAFATWSGKRLPSDPEWIKAAAWPVETQDQVTQWTFPWGDQLNANQACLWSEDGETPCCVDEFEKGCNPVGVAHLIGNVWEWMFEDFCYWDPSSPFERDSALASIRGGAFNTFFESQANAKFFSAQKRMDGRPNIGFRCVISARDVDCQPECGVTTGSESANLEVGE